MRLWMHGIAVGTLSRIVQQPRALVDHLPRILQVSRDQQTYFLR